MVKINFTHNFDLLIHTFLTTRHTFEQGFLALSTFIPSGYYYYLYIDKTRSQTNPTGKTGVSNFINVMQDFQPKRLRATA